MSDKFQNMTRDQVFASLNDIVERQAELSARGDDLGQKLEAKAADFKALQQRLAELENRGSAAAVPSGRTDVPKPRNAASRTV